MVEDGLYVLRFYYCIVLYCIELYFKYTCDIQN